MNLCFWLEPLEGWLPESSPKGKMAECSGEEILGVDQGFRF